METDPEGSVSAGYAAICGIGVGSMCGPSPRQQVEAHRARVPRPAGGPLGVHGLLQRETAGCRPLAGGPLGA